MKFHLQTHFIRRPATTMMLCFMWVGVAVAAIVTAADVAEALRNSGFANQVLRDNAAAVGSLALFESGGNTQSYNGTCCYGVLQMSTSNIEAAGYTTAEFQQLSLQAQVNAWAHLQSTALNDPVIDRLRALPTFDGQTVDFAFLLSCVQLGQGNCTRMLDSGRCNGFADRNGTTICSMANQTRSRMTGAVGPPPAPGGAPIPGGSAGQPPYQGPGFIGDPNSAFGQNAGASSDQIRSLVRSILAGLLVLGCAFSLLGNWSGFTLGKTQVGRFMAENQRIALLLITALVVLI